MIAKFIQNERYDVLSRKMNSDKEFKKYVLNKTLFLPENTDNVCRLWHIKNDVYFIPHCLHCNAPTSFSKMRGSQKGYKKYCSDSCRMSYINTHRTEQETIIRNIKIQNTCLTKYGTEHFSASNKIKEQKRQTYQSKYGVDNPSQLDWVKEKKKNTNLLNRGVENPSQSHEIQSKKSRHSKNKCYVSECGKVFHLEGYEPISLHELLQKHSVEDILYHTEIEKHIGKLWYIYENRSSVYHPDFFIISQNKIIEVKSSYWYNKDFARNCEKKKACQEAGYEFEFWVYDGNGSNKLIL